MFAASFHHTTGKSGANTPATGTAFGSLWLSHHPGTSSMGSLLALSLAWTLVSVLLFMPALLGDPPRGALADTRSAR